MKKVKYSFWKYSIVPLLLLLSVSIAIITTINGVIDQNLFVLIPIQAVLLIELLFSIYNPNALVIEKSLVKKTLLYKKQIITIENYYNIRVGRMYGRKCILGNSIYTHKKKLIVFNTYTLSLSKILELIKIKNEKAKKVVKEDS